MSEAFSGQASRPYNKNRYTFAQDNHGRIMVPSGPEAWKRLQAPRTYICNSEVMLALFLLLSYLLRNAVYVKKTTICAQLAPKQRKLDDLYVERGLLHFNINIVYSKVLQALEISGPKVVLLCKFSLYWAVQTPIGARALRLQPYHPHGWSGSGPSDIWHWVKYNKWATELKLLGYPCKH